MRYLTTADFIEYLLQKPTSYGDELGRIKTMQYLSEVIDQYDLRPKVPVFSVTGTNGKGSTVHAIASILMRHGLRVGIFTSPHLLHIGERISVNLQPMSEVDILALANDWSQKAGAEKLGNYDFLLLLALSAFKHAQVDVMVLEVGIGGRLDALNVLEADVVVLTNIAFDHMHLLGNSREAIGGEKIALLRQDKVFVCGDLDPPSATKQQIDKITANAFWINQQFGVVKNDYWMPYCMLLQLSQAALIAENVACAMMAVAAFYGKEFLKERPLKEAFDNFHLPGRCQKLDWNGCEIILDVAHNPEAIAHLAKYIHAQPDKPTRAIVGMMKDKDILNSLKSLLPYVRQWYCCDIEEKRGATALQLKEVLLSLGVDENSIYCQTSVSEAWNALSKESTNAYRLICFGSFRVVEAMFKLSLR